VMCDFNQWLKGTFFEDVAADGIHLLVYAFPHGVRPEVRRDDWPAHYRTAWYAEMADGSNYRIKLDVEALEFDALPVVTGAPNEVLGEHEVGDLKLRSLVIFDDGNVIDGAALATAIKQLRAEGRIDEIPPFRALKLSTFSDFKLAEVRARLADHD